MGRGLCLIVGACLCLWIPTRLLSAQQEASHQTVIVVVGAPGTAEYETQFQQWARLWQQACTEGGARHIQIGVEDCNVSDSDRLKTLLADTNYTQGGSVLWLVLIGHGTYDGRTAKFNLRGPDVSADELAEWLVPVERPLAVINTASCSAPFLQALSGPDRVVITATRSGFERNVTRLGGALAAAIADPQADLDKDGQTSLLEAYLTAADRVDDFYLGEGRLKTEHALLDDNGDGLGTPADWFQGIRPTQRAADGAELDGYRAHQLHLVYNDTEAQLTPAVRAKRDRLELQVMHLRDNRDQYDESEYYQKLETLLMDLAEIYVNHPWGVAHPQDKENDTADSPDESSTERF